MRHTSRIAITSLVVVFIFMAQAPMARADETTSGLQNEINLYDEFRSPMSDDSTNGTRAFDPPEDEISGNGGAAGNGEEEPDVYNFDFRRTKVKTRDRIVLGYTYSELVLGGGVTDTLDEGREADIISTYAYAQGSIRYLTINLSRVLTMQIGNQAMAEYAAFESGSYKGDKMRFGLSFETAFLHVSPQPLGSALFRFGVAYDRERGHSRVSNYELDFQESWLLRGEIVLETYVTSIRTGGRYRVWGNQVIRPAFFHAIQAIFRGNLQVAEKRHETFNGPDTDNSSLEAQMVAFIYRGVQPNGEWAIGALFGARWHRAAGYNSVDHNSWVPTLQYGVVVRFQLWKHLMLNVNASLHQELADTDRLGGSIGANLTLFDW